MSSITELADCCHRYNHPQFHCPSSCGRQSSEAPYIAKIPLCKRKYILILSAPRRLFSDFLARKLIKSVKKRNGNEVQFCSIRPMGD